MQCLDYSHMFEMIPCLW